MMAPNADGGYAYQTALAPAAAPGAALGIAGAGLLSGLSRLHSAEISIWGAGGNTGGPLDIYLQTRRQDGTWQDYAHLPQIAAAGAAFNFRFAVSKNGPTTTITAFGTGTDRVLPVNTLLGGDFGDDLRLALVSGALTTAAPNAVNLSLVGSY